MNDTKWILWDFDGTLASRPGMWSGAMAEVLERHEPSLRCEREAIRPFLQSGFPWHAPEKGHENIESAAQWWDALFPVLQAAFVGVGASASRAHELARQVPDVYLDKASWNIFEDVLDALDTLTSQGWAHAILSNHTPELPALVQALGLENRIERVFTSATLGYEKPHPLAFARAMEHLGNPSRAWMIGDSYTADVAGATSAGLSAILVRSTHESALRQCSSLRELPSLT